MILTENSFYSSPSDMATLLGDKTRVADIFYTNFVGFIGLLKIKDSAALNSYIKQLGKLQISNMSDTNKDWSLCIKIAHDAGVINSVAANMATKFLALVKTGKVGHGQIQDNPIRDILKACRIQSHKPSVRLFQAISDFIDATDTLETTTVKLWKLSARSEMDGVAKEFREQITLGGYSSAFIHHQGMNGIATTPALPSVIQPTKQTSSIKAPGILPGSGAAKGSDSEYMSALLHVFKLKGGIHAYLDRFGFRQQFDVPRFKKAIMSPEFIVTHDYHIPWSEHPFIKWIKKHDAHAASEVVRILNDKDRQKSNIAHNVQVSNTAPPAPKVSVTIAPEVKKSEPLLTRDTVRELYLASTPQEFDAVCDKYNLPKVSSELANFLGSHKLAILSHLQTFSIPKPASEIFEFARVVSLLSSRMGNWNTGHLKYIPIIQNLKQAVDNKDEDSFFDIIKDFNVFDAINSTMSALTGTYSHIVLDLVNILAGDKPLSFYSRNFNRPFIRNSGNIWDSLFRQDMASSRADIVLGAMLSSISHRGNNLLTDAIDRNSITTEFTKLGIQSWVTHNTITLDKDSYEANCPAELDTLIKVIMDSGITKITIEKIDATKKNEMAFDFDLDNFVKYNHIFEREKAYNSLVKIYMADEKIPLLGLFSRLCVVSIMLKGIASGINVPSNFEDIKKWFFAQISKTDVGWDKGSFSSWNTSNFRFLDEYFDWLKSNNEVDGIKKIIPHLLSYGASEKKYFGEIWEEYPQFKDILLNHLKTRDLDGSKILEMTGNNFDEEVADIISANELYTYTMNLANTDDMLGVKKSLVFARKKYPAIFSSGADKIQPNYGDSRFQTCWFVLPSDPNFEQAKTTAAGCHIRTFGTLFTSKNGEKNIFSKVIKQENPELFDVWVNAKKKEASVSIVSAMDIGNYIDEDTHSSLLIEALNNIPPSELKAGLTFSNGSSSYFLSRASGIKSEKAKKEILLKFAPAMEVANVQDIKEKEQRDNINTSFCDLLMDVYTTDKKTANRVFGSMPRTTRNLMVKRQGEVDYIDFIKEDLYKHPIKPDFVLDQNRIRQLLKYNNIGIKISAAKHIVKTIDDIKDTVKQSITKVGALKISEPEHTTESIDRDTIRLNKTRNKNHGNVGVKVLKTYDVEFPGNKALQEAFRAQNPRDGTVKPVFHGTGTVAASMILRNGFTIISANDQSTVGRLLGNGIYFSNIINKASQYVGDKGGGITRQKGVRGYVFEMEAELGLSPKNYRAAGLGGDSIRSPEWAVFDPPSQLRIYKAYYVELTTFDEVKQIAAKYGETLNEETSLKSFDNFLFESREGMEVSTFLFKGESIPTSLTEYVSIEDYKPRKNVFLEPGADGTFVVIQHSNEIEPVVATIPNTAEWIGANPEEVKIFLDLIKN